MSSLGSPTDSRRWQSVEVQLGQAGQRFVAQVLVHAALDDAEQRVGVGQALELVARALGPAQAHAHRLGGFFMRGRAAVDLIRRAFVELHHDVGVQRALDLHRDLGRQEELVAIDRRCERDAIFGNLAQIAQRKHLETAGIGQDRLVPADKAVQALVGVDHVQPGAQPQVEGVAQDDLRVDFIELQRRHRLDRAIGAHRHEDRRFDHAVVQRDAAAAGVAVGGDEFEVEHGG